MARSGLDANRKFQRLAQALNAVSSGMGEVMARGILETLWSAAYERADDYLGDSDDVEIAAKWRGERGALTAALAAAGGPGRPGFIEVEPDDSRGGGYRIHDLWDHAPPWVKKKAEAEAKRRKEGKSLSDVRREAGRKGAEKLKQANGQQPIGESAASGQQAVDFCPANDSPGKGREGTGRALPPKAPPGGAEGVGSTSKPPDPERPQQPPHPAPRSLSPVVTDLVGKPHRAAALAPDGALLSLVIRTVEQHEPEPEKRHAAAAAVCDGYDRLRAGYPPGKKPDWTADGWTKHGGKLLRMLTGHEPWPPAWTSQGGTSPGSPVAADEIPLSRRPMPVSTKKRTLPPPDLDPEAT